MIIYRSYSLGTNAYLPNGEAVVHIYTFSHEEGRELMRVRECEMKDGETLAEPMNVREEVYVPHDPSDPLSESILINVNGMQYNTIENSRRLYKYLLKKGFNPVPTFALDKA
jgi:hypothetical protein